MWWEGPPTVCLLCGFQSEVFKMKTQQRRWVYFVAVCGFFLFSPPSVFFFSTDLTKFVLQHLKVQYLYPFSAKLSLQGGNNEAINTGHYTWPQSVLLTLLLDFTTEHLDVVSFLLFSITLFILRGLFRSQLANCDHCCVLWSNQAASGSRTDRH